MKREKNGRFVKGINYSQETEFKKGFTPWNKGVKGVQKAWNKTHGLSQTGFWITFNNIKSRCNNPKNNRYHIYGQRGIKCLWNSFDEFKKDMYESYLNHLKEFGEKNTSIDRINNDAHYCKENCRWATRKQQARNTRNNVFIEFDGKKLCLKEWEEVTGIKEATIRARIRVQKWTIDKALTTMVR